VENIDTPLEQQPSNIASVTDLIVTPNNPPWNGWIAIGYWILSVIFIIVVPGVFLVPYLISQGVDLRDRDALMNFIYTDKTAVVLQLAPIILAHVLTLAAGWLIVTRLNRYSFRKTLGWSMGGFRWWHALLITFVFYGFGYLMTSVFGRVENEFERLIAASRAAVYLVAFLATFTAPVVEEVVYRGVVFSAFQRKFGITIAIVIVTVLFTIVHVPQYSQNSVPDYASVITLLFLSLALTIIRAGTGNLLPCVVLHTIFNGLQSIVLIMEPFFETAPDSKVDPTGLILQLFR
jgi:membrane protease YdiL (CAAX protease family)